VIPFDRAKISEHIFFQKGCPSECCSHYRLCSGEERARQGAASHLENGGGRLRQHSIYCAYSTQMDTPFFQTTFQ